MTCPLCKGDVIKGKTNLPYEIGKNHLLVVSEVPAKLCKQCGESFIEIEVVRNLEKIVAAAERDGIAFGFINYKEATQPAQSFHEQTC